MIWPNGGAAEQGVDVTNVTSGSPRRVRDGVVQSFCCGGHPVRCSVDRGLPDPTGQMHWMVFPMDVRPPRSCMRSNASPARVGLGRNVRDIRCIRGGGGDWVCQNCRRAPSWRAWRRLFSSRERDRSMDTCGGSFGIPYHHLAHPLDRSRRVVGAQFLDIFCFCIMPNRADLCSRPTTHPAASSPAKLLVGTPTCPAERSPRDRIDLIVGARGPRSAGRVKRRRDPRKVSPGSGRRPGHPPLNRRRDCSPATAADGIDWVSAISITGHVLQSGRSRECSTSPPGSSLPRV